LSNFSQPGKSLRKASLKLIQTDSLASNKSKKILKRSSSVSFFDSIKDNKTADEYSGEILDFFPNPFLPFVQLRGGFF
jgi:hypothetical protein